MFTVLPSLLPPFFLGWALTEPTGPAGATQGARGADARRAGGGSPQAATGWSGLASPGGGGAAAGGSPVGGTGGRRERRSGICCEIGGRCGDGFPERRPYAAGASGVGKPGGGTRQGGVGLSPERGLSRLLSAAVPRLQGRCRKAARLGLWPLRRGRGGWRAAARVTAVGSPCTPPPTCRRSDRAGVRVLPRTQGGPPSSPLPALFNPVSWTFTRSPDRLLPFGQMLTLKGGGGGLAFDLPPFQKGSLGLSDFSGPALSVEFPAPPARFLTSAPPPAPRSRTAAAPHSLKPLWPGHPQLPRR